MLISVKLFFPLWHLAFPGQFNLDGPVQRRSRPPLFIHGSGASARSDGDGGRSAFADRVRRETDVVGDQGDRDDQLR